MNAVTSDVRRLVPVLLAAVAVYAVVLAAFAAGSVGPLELVQDAGDDPTRALHAGLLSHVGVFGWVATAAITLFAGLLTYGTSETGMRRWVPTLLLCGGLLSAMLGIDDFFLLHDRVIPQRLAYGTYALLGLLIAGVFLRTLVRAGGAGVLLAGGLLAGSIAVDVLQNRLPGGYVGIQVVEEGLKFAGIACWLFAWSRVAATGLTTDRSLVAA